MQLSNLFGLVDVTVQGRLKKKAKKKKKDGILDNVGWGEVGVKVAFFW